MLTRRAGDAVETVLTERLVKRVRKCSASRCARRRSSRGNKLATE